MPGARHRGKTPAPTTVAGTGRRTACTRCRADRPTVRNCTFGSLGELGGWHRVRWVAPQKVGGTGQANCLHPVSGGPPDRKKLHIRLAGRIGGVAPGEVGGTGNSGWHRQRWVAPAQATHWTGLRPQGCQRADRHHTIRRRHKPALSRAIHHSPKAQTGSQPGNPPFAEGTNWLSAGHNVGWHFTS